MKNTDLYYEEIQKNIEKLELNEKYRQEKHDRTRIIFHNEISPLQIYQNVMDNTVFIYKNRVPEEGTKVITRLKVIKRNKVIGSLIQWIGILLIAAFVLLIFSYRSLRWDSNIKLKILLLLFFGSFVFIFAGGLIRISGRKFMGDYIEVWNQYSIWKGPVEINCLKNGQLAIIKYRHRDKSRGEYLSALNPDGTIWHGNLLRRMMLPTYVRYIYIMDSVKSCARTENGLMIESSGKYYGIRGARYKQGRRSGNRRLWFYVFAETRISYRKEEIPAILDHMEQLEAALINYGRFQSGINAFSPLGKNCGENTTEYNL